MISSDDIKSAKIFGTDGVRGLAGATPITAVEILNLAQAVGSFAIKNPNKNSGNKKRVIIGKDTRLSGYMLEPALTAGLIGTGCDVILLGPLPTPAVAMLTKSLRADIGIMISASHNPYHDNGIKIFNHDGFKLNGKQEKTIESLLQKQDFIKASGDGLGRAKRLDSARGRYVEYVKATFPYGMRLDGLKIAVDCAHGAAYRIAPDILYELGAVVVPLGVDPNGCNINENCGALSTDNMQKTVVEQNCDLGIALDGDADRVIMCDRHGRLLNGDKILGIIADYYKQTKFLKGAVVGTVMANFALEESLKKQQIDFIRTAVGDKNITARMLSEKCNLGGEQSGHIIVADYGYVGDGLLASLQVLAASLHSKKDLSELHDIFEALPQKIINMKLPNMDYPVQAVDDIVAEASSRLQDGRVLVRPSGTEPLLRLMAEAADEKILDEILKFLEDKIGAVIR